MARPLRIQGAGLTYHVYAHSLSEIDLYLDAGDRWRFLAFLEEAVKRYALRCHAYCEMTNHYHSVITTTEPNLSQAMQWLHSQYAAWWNWRHARRGHAFRARFGAQIVEDRRYLLDVCRYVVLNPVRAGMVRTPEQWPWSSYRAMIGYVQLPPFMQCDRLFELVSPDDPTRGPRRFRQFVLAGDSDSTVERIRNEAILGDDDFVASFQPYRANAGREVPARQGRRSLDAIFAGAITREARNAAVVTAFEQRYPLSEIARYLRLHPSTIGKIVATRRCQSVKKARVPDQTP